MLNLTMGANALLDDEQLNLCVEWPAGAGVLDCSMFLLGKSGKVRSDADMIFYNQREDDARSVVVAGIDAGLTRFEIDLARVPQTVESIAVCAVVEGERVKMNAFAGLAVVISGRTVSLTFGPDVTNAVEMSLRLVELYRRNGQWKVRAVGQGFKDGLARLAGSFGVDVEEDSGPSAGAPPSPPAPPPPPPPAPPPAAQPDVRPYAPPATPAFTAVRRADFRSREPESRTRSARVATAHPAKPAERGLLLTAEQEVQRWSALGSDGSVVARLSWTSQVGGANGRGRPLRLSLGALYALTDGSKGALQDPDNEQAPSGARPILTLGALEQREADGNQSIAIKAADWGAVHSLVLYAVIDGPPNWQASTIRLELSAPGVLPISLVVEHGEDDLGALALVRLDRQAGDAEVRRLLIYGRDQQDLDAEMAWGLDWRLP